MSLSIVQVRLPSGETPVCGVAIKPYIQVKRENNVQVSGDEVPEEGQGDSKFSLRIRWYRSVVNKGGAVCCVHPDREALLQCILCLRARVETRKSFHCSTECFKANWGPHRMLHEQRLNGHHPEMNGYVNDNPRASNTFSNSGETWIEVGRGRAYTPVEEDIGSVLKVEATVIDKHAVPTEVGKSIGMSTARVRPTPLPPVRAMVPLPPGTRIRGPGSFTVLTYNMLADLYATAEQFNYCQPWMLAWPYRKQNLLKEILSYDADILCLQEVQSNHYQDFLLPELKRCGYDAVYKKKTTEIFTGQIYAADGCATFYKTTKFRLMKKYEVEFNKAAISLVDNMNEERKRTALNRLLKDNVALISVLEELGADDGSTPNGLANGETEEEARKRDDSSRQLVCVANTHIHANPGLSDVKLWQVSTLLKGLEKIHASADIPMVVAGDFNSKPGSAAHQLLLQGQVDPKHQELANDPLKILTPLNKLTHKLKLSSAYSPALDLFQGEDVTPRESALMIKQRQQMDPATHEPKVTNVGKEFQGTLDYIFYTTNNMVPVSALELPEEKEVASPDHRRGLPNEHWSSDHIALMACFNFRSRDVHREPDSHAKPAKKK